MSTYPHATSNRNVPVDAFLLAEESYTSGECVETWYIDVRDDTMYRVCDWVLRKPILVMQFEACRVTGDTVNMIAARYRQHQERLATRNADRYRV